MLIIWHHRFKIYSILLIFFLLLTAPASLFVSLIHSLAPNIMLADGKGSFWQGESSHAIVRIDEGGSIALGKLQWSLKPLNLLWLSPAIEITTQYAQQSLYFHATAYPTGTVSIENLRGEFPLSILEPWAPLLITGQVFIAVPTVSLSANTLNNLDASVNLRDIIWQGGDMPMPLGHYQAQFTLTEEVINVSLNDQNAKLGLTGTVTAELSGAYKMDLQLTEGGGLNPAVMKSVAWLGKKQGTGVVIKREGSWK